MGRVTTTVYICDKCGKEVARPRDLTHFTMEFFGRGGRNNWAMTSDRAQLCDDCVPKLLSATRTFFPDEALDSIDRLVEEQLG